MPTRKTKPKTRKTKAKKQKGGFVLEALLGAIGNTLKKSAQRMITGKGKKKQKGKGTMHGRPPIALQPYFPPPFVMM